MDARVAHQRVLREEVNVNTWRLSVKRGRRKRVPKTIGLRFAPAERFVARFREPHERTLLHMFDEGIK